MNLLKKTNDWCHDDTNQHINKKNKGYIVHLKYYSKFIDNSQNILDE